MPGSHAKVDYRIRPAKNIERKMMAETFTELDAFAPLKSYRYIGFGSIYFSDYVLLHRALGIHDMISLESDPMSQARVEFNKPFGCVKVIPRDSTSFLTELKAEEWARRTIYWLDYDETLTSNTLTDIGLIAENASSGSFLAVTVDTRASEFELEQPDIVETYDMPGLAEPITKTERDDRWGLGQRFRDVLNTRVVGSVITRNQKLSGSEVVDETTRYDQVLNFRYADSSATMLTVGGLFSSVKETDQRAKFLHGLPEFVRTSASIYPIDPPKLTLKELRILDRLILESGQSGSPPDPPPIQAGDRERYEAVHRYFPKFVEAEF
jgi:hypothetical protein